MHAAGIGVTRHRDEFLLGSTGAQREIVSQREAHRQRCAPGAPHDGAAAARKRLKGFSGAEISRLLAAREASAFVSLQDLSRRPGAARQRQPRAPGRGGGTARVRAGAAAGVVGGACADAYGGAGAGCGW